MKKINQFAIVSIFLFPLITPTVAQTLRSGHGELCNAAFKCDKRAWLTCQNKECVCMFPEEMIYDNTTKKCTSKSGERCKFQVSNSLADPETLAFYDQTECVASAKCGEDGICSCVPNYYEYYDGSCQPEMAHNGNCTTDVECSQMNHLACINGVCDCDANQLLNRTDGFCVGKAGLNVTGKSCVEGSTDVGGVCTCLPEDKFYDGPDGRCHQKRGHLESCSEDRHCLQGLFLSCNNGNCTCDASVLKYEVAQEEVIRKKPKNCLDAFKETIDGDNICSWNQVQCGSGYNAHCISHSQICDGEQNCYYNMKDESPQICSFCKNGVGSKLVDEKTIEPIHQCVGLASKPCSPKSKCVENAVCYKGSCVCNRGYAARKDGTCGNGFWSTCTPSSKCGDDFVCSGESKCRCPSLKYQIYDAEKTRDKCISLIRGPCEFDKDCITNSFCETKESTNIRQCSCKPGYIENEEGKCDLAHGSKCSNGNSRPRCDTASELECLDGICSCPDSMTHFDPNLFKCLGLEGTRCIPFHSKNYPVCVKNASCVTKRFKTIGFCVCDEGFNSTKDRFCEAETEEVANETTEDNLNEFTEHGLIDLFRAPEGH